MRIARILTRANLGGPARQALASDPLLARKGHVLRVYVGTSEPGEGDLVEDMRSVGIDVVRVRGLRRGIAPFRDVLVRRRIERELASFRPDVVHTHASKAGTVGRQALARVPRARAVARVHTFHGHVLEGYFPAAVSRRLIAHERALAGQTDRIVAVSHATADDLVRLGVCGEEKIVVVPPGIDMRALLAIDRDRRPDDDALRARLGVGAGDLLAGVVGRLAPVKRPAMALDVFAALRASVPGLHVVFVGDGSERRELERRILGADGETRRRVHLLGAVRDMAPVLRALDVVLSCSRSEGLPVALIEAAAAALPVVATDVGGVAEVVVHERTGFLGTSAEELAFWLARLAGDAHERRATGERARLRISVRHTADELAGRLEKVYEAVSAERATQERDQP